MSNLPTEILLQIFDYLVLDEHYLLTESLFPHTDKKRRWRPQDLVAAGLTCRTFYQASLRIRQQGIRVTFDQLGLERLKGILEVTEKHIKYDDRLRVK